jgi:branched-chain amino acid transport system substrate-binding protein
MMQWKVRGSWAQQWTVTATALAVGTIALVGWGSPSGASGSSPIILGVDAAQSGAAASQGLSEIAGVKAYVAYINKQGGVLGHKFQVVVEDDQSQPTVAASLVQKLVEQDHAQYIVGPENSNTVAAAIPAVDSAHVVNIGWGSGWPITGVTTAQSQSYAFPGILNAATSYVPIIVKDLIQAKHLNRVAVMGDSTPFSLAIVPALQEAAKSDGFTLTSDQQFPFGATDATPQVLKALATHPNLVIAWSGPGADLVTLFQAIRTQDPTIPIVAITELSTPSFISAVGPAAMENSYESASPVNFPNAVPAGSETANQVNAYYQWMKATGSGAAGLLSVGWVGWSSVAELTSAIKSAGSLSESKVKNALAHQHASILGTEWARTPTNYQHISSLLAYIAEYQNGSFVVVK